MQCPQPYLICNLGNPQTGIVARSSEDFEFFLLLIFSSNTGLLDFIMDSEEAVEGATLDFLRNFILDLLPLPPRLGVPGLVYNTKTFLSDQYSHDWVLRPPSVRGVEVAKASAAAKARGI